MRRLAIIDVAGGGQPVRNGDGTVLAVCDGEIYNFAELRATLLRQGHRFATLGDTECLVHLYEEHGDELVHRLRGMFAFAIWDVRRRRLLLGRDRVGKKPLYWRPDGVRLWFASQASALLEDPGLVRNLDHGALHHYLTYQYVPAPWSIYRGVHKLPPGHLLTWQDGVARVRPYWRLDAAPQPVADEGDAAQQLRELLLDAVRVRMGGERPVGALLSGDVHSSAVVAAMAQQSREPVQTFHIAFEETTGDGYARAVARRYGTEHHELVVAPTVELLPDLARDFDEPFADPSAITSYYVARLARQHVAVVLTGDGGDETFGGHRRYGLMNTLGRIPALPPAGLFDWVGTRLAARGSVRGRLPDLARALALLGLPPERRYGPMMSLFSSADKAGLYTDDLRAQLSDLDSLELLNHEYDRSKATDIVGRLIDADVNTYLSGDLLTKMDAVTMAHSLEARAPLLDHRLLEWAAHLPTEFKVRPGTTKYLFKRAVARWLPGEVVAGSATDSGVPLAAWIRTDLRDLARDVLTDDTARSRGLFRPESVSALLRRHAQGRDESRRLWALIQFELWHRRFLDPVPSSSSIAAAVVVGAQPAAAGARITRTALASGPVPPAPLMPAVRAGHVDASGDVATPATNEGSGSVAEDSVAS